MKNLEKTALIGAGVIGKTHAENMAAMGLPFDAICDIDEAKAKALAERFSPDALIFTDYKKMIDELRPTAVHVCTPHYLHAEMIIYALSRDVNVLCEKPLCISYEQIDSILEAEKHSQAMLGVCFQNRYLGTNRFAKDYIADQRIVSAHGSVVWQRGVEYYRSADWRGTLDKEGGGVLINQAIHTLDLLEWLCGEPREVLANTDNLSLRGEIEVEDTVSAFFDGDVPFSIFATNASFANMPVSIEMKTEDKKHVVLTPDTFTVNGETLFSAKKQSFAGKSYYGCGHGLLFADFYDCIKNSRHFPIDGKEAAKVMRLVLAVYESNGEKIAIK